MRSKKWRKQKSTSRSETDLPKSKIFCVYFIYTKLSRYQSVPAAREKTKMVETEGKCVENAIHDNTEQKLLRFCDYQTNTTFFGACICNKGFEQVGNTCNGMSRLIFE